MLLVRLFLILIVSFFIPSSLTMAASAQKKHAISMYGAPKYKERFSHFDYVSPKAPKGGSLIIGAIGTFDGLNPYSFKGIPASGTGVLGPNYLFDSLMTPSGDEPETLYGLVAEGIEVPDDRSWALFTLNKKAKWADGTPITTADVKFTFETIREHGRAFMQSLYKKVDKVEVLGPHRIKFTFKTKEDPLTGKQVYQRDAPLILARMVVLPKHIMAGKDFHKLTQTDMVGSGPYRIKEVKMGHSISYARRDDYWAKDLNVRKGLYNFETIRYDYYRNIDVLFEAFKAGEFDLLIEKDPKRWQTAYTFPAVQKGRVKKLELVHQRPVGMRAFVMNTRRPIFKDRRIRQALIMAFDFNWVNRNLYYNTFSRTHSYFENTELASQGMPSSAEKKLLTPFKASLPDGVLTQAYPVPAFTTPQQKRRYLSKAKELLRQAGCRIEKGKLIHPLTQKPFMFQIMITRTEEEKLALELKRNLKTLGINVSVQIVDETQYWARTADFDFDMVIFLWSGSLSPSGGVLVNRWGTASMDRKGSLNYMGCSEPAIDAICGQINQARTWEQLATGTKALDRVLLWGHYVIPLFHDDKNRVAIWDKFGYPKFNPKMGLSTTAWWSKKSKPKS